MKIAILFPGIGYHCDKPLLYYSGKLAAQYQYEVIKVPYTNLSRSIPEAFADACIQTETYLENINWNHNYALSVIMMYYRVLLDFFTSSKFYY